MRIVLPLYYFYFLITRHKSDHLWQVCPRLPSFLIILIEVRPLHFIPHRFDILIAFMHPYIGRGNYLYNIYLLGRWYAAGPRYSRWIFNLQCDEIDNTGQLKILWIRQLVSNRLITRLIPFNWFHTQMAAKRRLIAGLEVVFHATASMEPGKHIAIASGPYTYHVEILENEWIEGPDKFTVRLSSI